MLHQNINHERYTAAFRGVLLTVVTFVNFSYFFQHISSQEYFLAGMRDTRHTFVRVRILRRRLQKKKDVRIFSK